MEDGVGELIIVVQKFFSASTNSANSPYCDHSGRKPHPLIFTRNGMLKPRCHPKSATTITDKWRGQRDLNSRPSG